MRVSAGILASAAVLLLLGSAGLVGTWALASGTFLVLVGGVGMVIAMEERDQAVAGVAAVADTPRTSSDPAA